MLVGNIFVGNILSLKYSEGESWRFSFSILHFRHDVPKLYYGLILINDFYYLYRSAERRQPLELQVEYQLQTRPHFNLYN